MTQQNGQSDPQSANQSKSLSAGIDSQNAPIRSLSDLLQTYKISLNTATDDHKTSINDILKTFHERGFGMILFIFALPMALPLPVPPGINILLASPLLILTFQQMIGRSTLWLPQRLTEKKIKTTSLCKILHASIPWVMWIENLTCPRLGFMTRGLMSHTIGLAGFIMALAVCIPIPLSNTVPSFGIALMALGVLMRDGLAVMLGMFIGLAWVACLTAVLIFIGMEGIDIIKDIIKSWL